MCTGENVQLVKYYRQTYLVRVSSIVSHTTRQHQTYRQLCCSLTKVSVCLSKPRPQHKSAQLPSPWPCGLHSLKTKRSETVTTQRDSFFTVFRLTVLWCLLILRVSFSRNNRETCPHRPFAISFFRHG